MLTAAVFLVTVVAHEVAHAIVARHFGIRVKGITLWMLGGVTELDGESPSPRAEATVAIAGPATSIGLGDYQCRGGLGGRWVRSARCFAELVGGRQRLHGSI